MSIYVKNRQKGGICAIAVFLNEHVFAKLWSGFQTLQSKVQALLF